MTQVSYKEMGAGQPLILIHGFCETGRIWDRFADNLSTRYRVLVPDLPGFGGSPLPSIPFTINNIGESMLNWINQLQVDNPVIIGHSLGGYVTLAMAEREQDRIKSFGLFHSTAYADSEEKKENRNKVIDFVRRHGVKPYIDTFVPGLFYQKENPFVQEVYEIASETSAEALVNYAIAMRDRPSMERLLETFPRPILMIAGEQDTIVPFEPSVSQTKLMKYPFFRGLTGVGHMGMFENERESLEIVKQFLNLALEFEG